MSVRARWIFIGIVLAVVLTALGLARFYTDYLWFLEVELESVLWRSLGTQFALGAVVGVIVAILIFANLLLASRLAPTYRIANLDMLGSRPDPLDQYRVLLSPYLMRMRIGLAAFVGLIAGLTASQAWKTYLLWVNGGDFGRTDPQFGRDVGFYVFDLPFYKELLGWAWFGLFAALLLTLAAHYFHGSLRVDRGLAGVSAGALAHVSVLLGLLAVVKAALYWFGTYELNFSSRGTVTGASYTDVNAHLPALKLLAIISIISAVLFIVNIWFRRVALPLAAVGIWILTSVLAGGVWPWAIQRFSVDPQELQRERPYIERNLDATRAAFNLDEVSSRPFLASSDLAAEDIEANDDLIQNVRLWDPGVLNLAYQQLQSIRTYYHFEDVDIDRYTINGETRQVLLSARELSVDDLAERTKKWVNVHLQFTHGFGLVASLANEASVAGQPRFLVHNVPGTVVPGAEDLETDEPRLYYGEGFDSDEYSIVDTKQEELDYPLEEGGAARSSYAGEGGITVGSFFKKLAFAIREGDPNLVLSNLIDGDSQILIYKNVRDRVLRAAPFLSIDHDPYPAVVDGRLVWILDGYTSTAFFPYSQRFPLGDIIEESEKGTLDGDANYVRNSVKIVVDAYDGTMALHVVDETDPLIVAWRDAFPELFTDEEPSDDLRAHFRYPEDLFKIQSDVYLTYHMTDPADFFSKEDEWSVPRNAIDATSSIEVPALVAPTYLLLKLPGDVEQHFYLTRPFTPRLRNNMIALMLASSDPESYGELQTLQFPRSRLVAGPLQVNNLINQEVEISQTLTLLRQGGSTVDFGSLVTLPIEESVLYIQPLFVTAADVGIPELKRVILVLGEQVVMGESFEEAVELLFGVAEEEEPPDEDGDGDGDGDGGEEPAGKLGKLVARAARIYQDAQNALAAGDFEEYGRLIQQLGDVLGRAQQLAQ